MEGATKKAKRLVIEEDKVRYEYEPFVVKGDFSNLKSVLAEKGAAIVTGVLNDGECEAFVSGMWNFLETVSDKKITKGDEKSWANISDLFPMHSMLIQHWGIGHVQCIWDIRQNPGVVEVFSRIWGTLDLLTSFDGASFHMPHETTGKGFYRGNSWFHTDQRLSDSKFQCVQGWVTGLDVNEGDGTLTILEGSHKYHEEFAKRFHPNDDNKVDWYKLVSQEELDFFLVEKKCKRVSMKCPKGSLVLWDSRTMHCGQEPVRNRPKPNHRCVAYVCMVPRALATAKNIKKKRDAFNDKRTTSHWPQYSKVFAKRPRTYGKPILIKEGVLPDPKLTPLGLKLAGF